MIYSRIKLARNLLTENGAIFISIGDDELINLKKICDEIFGEQNFVAICSRKTRGSATTKSDAEIQKLNDYILVYWKNKEKSSFNLKLVGEKKYPYEDERGKYYTVLLQDNGPHGTKTARPNLFYPIYMNEDGAFSLEKNEKTIKEFFPLKHKNDDGTWMWSKQKFNKDNKDLCEKNGKIYIKHYFNEEEDQNKYQREKNWLDEYLNAKGTIELNSLFEEKGLFSNPKPVELISLFLNMTTGEDSIVLDFFSGSGTTAQSVMQLNSLDHGSRTYILIQVEEEIHEDMEAFKAGYRYITELAQERIKRASNKIENNTTANIDYGFRVYKVDSSNMKNVYYTPDKVKQQNLFDYVSNIKEDRTSEDLLTQVILDLGLTLDLKIQEKDVLNNKVYCVDENSLIACFDNEIDINVVDEICKYNPLKVVFKDESFRTDNDKINLQERFKKLSPNTEICIL